MEQEFDVLGALLLGTAALLAAGAVSLLGLWIHASVGARGFGPVSIRTLGAMNRRLMWPRFESAMRRKLSQAGEPVGYRPEDILALQELGLVAGIFGGALVVHGIGRSLGWCLASAALGALLPLIWVNDQVKKRHLLIVRALPWTLDLLTLSVEAGLDFAAALAKVVEKGKGGPLRDELQIVLKQLRMGKTREEALRGMIARVELPPLTQFITALIQADKMGTSLGRVLRLQSTQLRIERTQRAEKRANEAPVKMLFPLVACIFPTVFMILFGPIVFALMFGHSLG